MDVVVAGKDEHRDPCVLDAPELGRQVLVARDLAVEGQVSQADKGVGALCDHVVYQGVDDGVEVARHDGALGCAPVEKPLGREQPRREVVQVGREQQTHGRGLGLRAVRPDPQGRAGRTPQGTAEKVASGGVPGTAGRGAPGRGVPGHMTPGATTGGIFWDRSGGVGGGVHEGPFGGGGADGDMIRPRSRPAALPAYLIPRRLSRSWRLWMSSLR